MKLRKFLGFTLFFLFATELDGAVHCLDYLSDSAWISFQKCSICLREIKDGNTLVFLSPCGDAFHQDCFNSCMEFSNSYCPFCSARTYEANSLMNPFDLSEVLKTCKERLSVGDQAFLDSVLQLKLLGVEGCSLLLHFIVLYPGNIPECCNLAQKLIFAGADVNHQSETYPATPLCEAVYLGKKDLINVLLSANAFPSIQCRHNGWTALDYARNKEDYELTSLLLSAGALSSTCIVWN